MAQSSLVRRLFWGIVDFVSNLFHLGGYLVAGAALASLTAFLVLTTMPGQSHEGPLPAATQQEAAQETRLRNHVRVLASAEHNMAHPRQLESAAKYLEGELSAMGYSVRRQPFKVNGQEVRNLEVTLAGADNTNRRVVVVGAHYDSGTGTPGANDNASGAAALLELARSMKTHGADAHADVMFVWYVNEEPPYFRTESMGSWVHAKQLKAQNTNVVAMLSLETLGYYSEAPNSQAYPLGPLIRWRFPSQGNFVSFVGDVPSYLAIRQSIRAFRQNTAFPSEGLAAPSFVQGTDWSDHRNYAHMGYPALMVTDTAPYRYPYYHHPADTPDKVDYAKLSRVTTGLQSVVVELAR
jgi:hypothetical protein